MPRVFLSRSLRADSPFHALVQQPEWHLEARSLIRFTRVALTEVPAAPWLFFYSARGVIEFFEQCTPRSDQRIACLGKGAARCLVKYGREADFIGTGVPDQVALDLPKIVGAEELTFVQARHSRASVQQRLPNSVSTSSVVVYDNHPLTDFTLAPADYLIFTSPLNFLAYRNRYALQPAQRFIAIGSTTADNFSGLIPVQRYSVASTPNEQALLSCLLNWERNDPISERIKIS